jgi:TPR repeat protein
MRIAIVFGLLLIGAVQLQADYYNDGVVAYNSGDYMKAKELWSKVCDSGVAIGCSSLATMYYNGEGIKQDYFKAKEFYTKACDSGYDRGCKNCAILTLAVN